MANILFRVFMSRFINEMGLLFCFLILSIDLRIKKSIMELFEYLLLFLTIGKERD